MKAKIVHEAAKLAMDGIIERWQKQLDNTYVLNGQQTVRVWRGWFKWEKKSIQRTNAYTRMIQRMIDRPTEYSDAYVRMTKLHVLALDAEKMDGGCQVFVSADDNIVLHSGLKRHESWFECQGQPSS